MKGTKYCAALSIAAITSLISGATVHAATGDIYDISNPKAVTLKYTQAQIGVSSKKQNEVMNAAGEFGYELSNQKIYTVKSLNDKIDELYKANPNMENDTLINSTFTQVADKGTVIADAKDVNKGVAIASVSAVNKTVIQVTLADGATDLAAADKASYTIKVGDTVVPVTAVAYVKDAKKATLTVDLTGNEGKVSVNAVEAKDAVDFKAPEVVKVTSANPTTIYVDFSEKLDKASAELVKDQYGIVVKGTATIVTPTKAELVEGVTTRVRLTVPELKEGTTYTLTVAGVKDASTSANAMTSASKDFVAVKDSVKPTVLSVTPVDGNPNATLTLKFSEEVTGTAAVKVQKYGKDGELDTGADFTKAINNNDSVNVDLSYRLEDGAKYCVTVSGVKDIATNTMDEQKLDITGVKDTVAPSVVSTESKDGKLTITFSEKLIAADTSAMFKDALTGADVNTATLDTSNEDTTKLVYTLGSNVKVGRDYVIRLTNAKDAAGNVMDAKNVTFAGTQAVVKVQLEAAISTVQTEIKDVNDKALPALAENTVAVKFNTSVSKAEAENIANYKAYVTEDKTKTLAVTKAVYDDSKMTVTLTTADQVQATGYTVEVAGLTNLDTDKATTTFTGVDYKAPELKSVSQTKANELKVTFNEKVVIPTGDTKLKATLVSTDYAETIGVTKTVDTDGNLLLGLGDKTLTGGKTYILRLEGVQDAQLNYRVAGSTSAVVTSTEVKSDTVAPKIVSAVAINARTVELTFDEELTGTPNVSVKDDKGVAINDLDSDNKPTNVIDVKGKKITLTTVADKFLTGKVYSVEVYDIADLVGNKVEAANKIATTFNGNKDEVSPKLVSAASSVIKGTDYKVGDKVIGTDKNYTKVTLTFDETVKLNVFAAVITTPDFTTLKVVDGSAKVGEDGKTVEFLLDQSTNAGDKYIVNVDKDTVTDVAASANPLDPNANYASFVGVDTTAPTLTEVKIADKDGKSADTDKVTIDKNSITLNLTDATTYATGTVKLSEDVKVSLNATGDKYDVSKISVSKDLDSSTLTNLVLGLFGKDGATGAEIKTALGGATLTLEDAAGNATTYTITAQ